MALTPLEELREQNTILTNAIGRAEGDHRHIRSLLEVFIAGLKLRAKGARTSIEAHICEDIEKALQFIVNESILRLPKRDDE